MKTCLFGSRTRELTKIRAVALTFLAVSLLALAGDMALHGQSTNSSMAGTIQDASGGVVPGAVVSLLAQAT
ncbi:MAG: hypothetical protein ACRD2B_12820, partial [Terriglobia bacterium]